MSDQFVGGRSAEMAVLLLAAVEDLGLDPSVVRTTSKGYIVPDEVAEKASVGDAEKASEPARAAKKTTAKKAASKPKGEE